MTHYPLFVCLGVWFVATGCERSSPDHSGNSTATVERTKPPLPSVRWFEDVTGRLGLEFKHNPGPTGKYQMPESIGSGGAFFDFDNDGRLDVFLIHSAPAATGARNQLFHQQPDGRFRNVSEDSGLDVSGPGMGAAVGDINNDGRPDVLLTEVGRTRLFVNRGGGHFTEITPTSGLDNTRWGTAASFLDYNQDGWLDVVVANYVDYSPTIKCSDTKGQPEYCGPQGMPGTAARLYRNLGAAGSGSIQFEDVTVRAGLVKKTGAALGVVCADLTRDGWIDILFADDGMPNRLFVNQQDGTFIEEAVQRGLAFNALGAAMANMGIAHGDVDGNGLTDLFMTHVSWEQHTIWKQGPEGLFLDQTAACGLGHPRLRGTGFGAVLADFDLDGDVELAMVNGRIRRADLLPPFLPGQDSYWEPYAQPNQLFLNDGSGRFQEIADAVLTGFSAVGRGLAYGDFDNDGAVDLLIMNTGAPARLLRNAVPATDRGHWLIVRAIDPALGGREAYGAELTAVSGVHRWSRLVQPGSSYLVSNDPRTHFGLGTNGVVNLIEVSWPDGSREEFPGSAANQVRTLRRGTGRRL